MSELNPNHPVTQETREQWHKIVFLLMKQMGKNRVVITPAEVYESIKPGTRDQAVTIRYSDDVGIELAIVDWDEGMRLARTEGGLPV